jgi:hypothetical protein
VSVLTRDLVCQQAVELVTGYLARVQAFLDATGRVGPEDLDASTLDGLVELFQRNKDEDR